MKSVEETPVKQRLDWLDILKLFGVLFVYIGHLGPNTGRWYPFVWMFHIPLLFFCSGYTHNDAESFWQFVKKKVMGLLVPFWFFLILCLMRQILLEPITYKDIGVFLLNGLLGTKSLSFAETLWFLPGLFSVSVIAKIFNKYIKNPVLRLAISFIIQFAALSWTGIHVPLCINHAISFFFYYELGVVLHSAPKEIKRITNYLGLLYGVFAALVYLRGALLVFDTKKSIVGNLWSTINNIMIILAFMSLAKLVEGCKQLAIVGRETLYLCGNEIIIKTVFSYLMLMLNLSNEMYGEMEPIIYCSILLWSVYKLLIPLEKPALEKIKVSVNAFFLMLERNLC